MGCFVSESETDEKYPEQEQKYIQMKYSTGKTIGKGGSCRVVVAKEKGSENKFALKIIPKREEINKDLYDKERDVLAKMDHPNIVKFVECHVDRSNFYIVTELCEGGELFDRIVDDSYPISEKKASQYIRTMLEAIKHCHDKNIVHRDLKPENFVFKTKAKDSEMVLIDFGCAMVVEPETQYKDLVGTPYYLAPESAAGNRYIRTGKVLMSSDLWAIGIITYVLMTGRPPFNGHSNQEIFSNIMKKPLRFPTTVKLSDSFVKFCQTILKKSPKKRMTLEDALDDPWVKGIDTSEQKLSKEVLRVLRQFNRQSKLKKAVTKTLAQHMGKEPKHKVEEHFKRLDKNGNGALSVDELSLLLMDMGYTKSKALEEAKTIIKTSDDDHSGSIEFEEFATIWQRKLLTVNDSYIHSVFNVLDTDGNGKIDASELAQVLHMTNEGDDEKIKELIEEVDTDHDNMISFKEFRNAMLERNVFTGTRADVGYKLEEKELLTAIATEDVNIDESDS